MNFTEAIRKSNLAKEEVLKTRTTAEDIKAALVEQGVRIEDTKFEDIAQFIKENNIGVSGPWERPKEWLALPKVVVEEPKYTNIAEQTQQDYSQTMSTYLSEIGGNLSEITTGMKDGVFNVSANDFAYEMLCKVEENSDNLLLFEGNVLDDNIQFTQLSAQDEANFLTDLFIQIDDEEPLNLTQLARGEITLPAKGKYKNISITNEEALFSSSGNGSYISNNIASGYTPISLLISLDYDTFDEETRMKNGDKQCIIKIWGNGFIRLTPYRSYNSKKSIVNYYNNPAVVKANNCILDVNICDSNIEIPFKHSTIDIYLPLTLECLLLGFGEFTQKISLISSLSPSYFKTRFTSQFLEGINSFNRDYYPSGPGAYDGFTIYSFNDSNFYMDLKEIDCSNVKYYNDYHNMMYFLFATPTRKNDMVYSMLGKVKNVENIVFPNFKDNIQDNECYLMYPIEDSNIDSTVFILSIMPYCFDLNAFKCLNRDSVVDLINKLPIIDLEINQENLQNLNLKDIYNTVSVQQLTVDNGIKNNIVTVQDDSSTSNSLSDIIEHIINTSACADCFNGNKELIKKYVLRFAGVDTDVHKTLFIRPKLDYVPQTGEGLSEGYIDKKMFHSIIVSSLTFKELAEDDIKLAEDKGWRIVTDINYPANMFREIGRNYNPNN